MTTVVFLLGTLVGVPVVSAAVFGYPVTLPGGVPLVAGLAGLLVLRRRAPVGVLLASVALVIALRTSGLIHVGWLWPATAAITNAVLYGRMRWVVGVGLVTLGFAASWDWAVGGGGVGALGFDALWFLVVVSAASAWRNRGRQRESDEARRHAEERLRIAREVHDVVAHTLTVVGVQLRVAAEAMDDAPDQARAAIATAQTVRSDALADLRGLVDVLRTDDLQPPARLADLPRIVAAVATADLAVELVETGEARAVPAPVGLALTRVVQESLTNVVRHARASRVTVELHYGASTVAVTVTDDGTGGRAGEGHGLAGLRERVTALGGTFSAGPVAHGFAVRAEIPAS